MLWEFAMNRPLIVIYAAIVLDAVGIGLIFPILPALLADVTHAGNVAPYIGQALRENSGLKVLVAQGYYDFATPFFAAEYALSRTGIPQDRIRYTYYDAGHMMYIRDEDRHKLSADIRAFIRAR